MPDLATDTPSPPLSPRTWPAWCGIGLLALAARLPWSLQRWLGRAAVGPLLCLALRERRRIAARNLALCFPGLDVRERDLLLHEHFAALGTSLFEFGRAWWGSVEALRRGIRIDGLEHLAAARAGGRGVIVVTSRRSPGWRASSASTSGAAALTSPTDTACTHVTGSVGRVRWTP